MNAYTAYTPKFRVRPARNAPDPHLPAGNTSTTRERAKPYKMPAAQPLYKEQKEPTGLRKTGISTPKTSPQPVIQVVPMPVPILVVTPPGAVTEVSTSSRHITMPGNPVHTSHRTDSHLPTIDRVFHSPEMPANTSREPTRCTTPPQQTSNPSPSVSQTPVTIQLDVRWQTIPQVSPIQQDQAGPEAETVQVERSTFNPSHPTLEEFCSMPTAKTRDLQPDVRPKTPFYCSD